MEKIDNALSEWHAVMLSQKYAADAIYAEWRRWSMFLALKYGLKGADTIDANGVIVRKAGTDTAPAADTEELGESA